MISSQTTDTFYSPSLRITQPGTGYRFSGDTVALAEFIDIAPSETLLDLCTGVGVVPLLLWQRKRFRWAVGVELQVELAQLAKRNVQQNQLDESILIVKRDIRNLTLATLNRRRKSGPHPPFDVVSANPPYWRLASGRQSPDLQKAIARHEVALTLDTLLAAVRRCLRPGGRVYLSHLRERENDVLEALVAGGFDAIRRQHPATHSRLLLVESRLLQR